MEDEGLATRRDNWDFYIYLQNHKEHYSKVLLQKVFGAWIYGCNVTQQPDCLYMTFISQIIRILCWLSVYCLGDEGLYVDSNSALIGTDNLDLKIIPVIFCSIGTSNVYLSGTMDDMYLTFIGSFASSGPHKIGPYSVGSMNDVSIKLQRIIGDLTSVTLQSFGFDGWLLSTLKCRINSTWYEFTNPNIWLEDIDPQKAINPTLDNVYGEQILDRSASIVARSNFEVVVSGIIYNNYDAAGLSNNS